MPLLATHRWRLRQVPELSTDLLSLGNQRGLPLRVISLLAVRGHTQPGDLSVFFDPPATALHDPLLLPDAARVVERVRLALARRERVLVVGDFDADGLCGLAILVLALRELGFDVQPYVPDRGDEGHGLSLAAVERARLEARSLVFTVDCGSSSISEVESAAALGIDVIITDHHRVPASSPPAHALVNTHRPDSRYPDQRLTGSGIAFKVAQLLLSTWGRGEDAGLGYADLAAIGTVADVAPILGENLAIARLGLERLRSAPRPGLAAILALAGLEASSVDLETIGFVIAPRLNAVGRVADPLTAARLLLATDADEAGALAAELDTANVRRRELTASALEEARQQLADVPQGPVTIVSGDWPVGVIGLVAGRLAEELRRPAVVFTTAMTPWRGSARSTADFDLGAAFEACAGLFERYGGHAAAAGCSLEPARLDAFRAHLFAAAGSLVVDATPELVLDLVVEGEEVDYSLLRDLQALAPGGPGNPHPLVGIAGLTVTRARGVTGGHTQLTLRKRREVVDAIAFGRGDLAEALREGDRVDLVARVASRRFGGFESLQLEVRDIATCGSGALPRSARPPSEVQAA